MTFQKWFETAVSMFSQAHTNRLSISRDEFSNTIRNYWDGITPEHQSLLWEKV